MGKDSKVDVLLATYNGEAYLVEQLDSLVNQSCQNFRVLIRDDCSTDSTPMIVQDFCAKHPNSFLLISDECGQVGVKENFRLLADISTAPYIMFCDQDDVWLPKKIECSLIEMKSLESKYGKEKPLLVHTDLQIVNQQLALMCSSYQKLRNVPSGDHDLGPLLIQCNVTGCTILMNRALRAYFLRMPIEAIMHDYWVALCAQVFGHRKCVVDEPLIQYRQHNNNHSGSRYPMESTIPFIWRMFKRQWKGMRTWNVYGYLQYKLREEFEKNRNQAMAFLNQFNDSVPNQDRQKIQLFIDLSSQSFIQRKKNIAKILLWPFTPIGKVIFWVLY